MEVGLTTSANPTHPTTSQHIGFVIKEPVIHSVLLESNVSINMLTFTLPVGTFMINAVIQQLDVPASTNLSSLVVNQLLGSDSVSLFTSNQLVPNNSLNDINVNVPIFNTLFNSVEQDFTISLLANYTSAVNINVTSNSYVIATRIA